MRKFLTQLKEIKCCWCRNNKVSAAYRHYSYEIKSYLHFYRQSYDGVLYEVEQIKRRLQADEYRCIHEWCYNYDRKYGWGTEQCQMILVSHRKIDWLGNSIIATNYY